MNYIVKVLVTYYPRLNRKILSSISHVDIRDLSIIKTARLFRGNPPVCRTGVAYDKAASSSLL